VNAAQRKGGWQPRAFSEKRLAQTDCFVRRAAWEEEENAADMGIRRRAPTPRWRLSAWERRRAQQALALDELRKAGAHGLCVDDFARKLGVHVNCALAIIAEVETAERVIDIWVDDATMTYRAKLVTESGQR